MAKRTQSGMVDPYISRRVGLSQKKPTRSASLDLKHGEFKDNALASRALDKINREYIAKESALAKAGGPHSTPAESHYPKVLKALPPPEEREEGEE